MYVLQILNKKLIKMCLRGYDKRSKIFYISFISQYHIVSIFLLYVKFKIIIFLRSPDIVPQSPNCLAEYIFVQYSLGVFRRTPTRRLVIFCTPVIPFCYSRL